MINIIVAISDNYAIGRSGDMPWHLSGDLKFFKAKTTGHTVVMGRKTWVSIGAKPLPNRRNIVITRSADFEAPGAEIRSSLEDALKENSGQEIFVIGGGQIYAQAIDLADRLYITHIHTQVDDADTFFPLIDSHIWKITEQSEVFTDEKSGLSYQFTTYERSNSKKKRRVRK
ncbi:MAG: dihydrofolate reductase [Bacteroidales bacterium]|nr:dihydrofolate reductase [Bacteroidales bacterium]